MPQQKDMGTKAQIEKRDTDGEKSQRQSKTDRETEQDTGTQTETKKVKKPDIEIVTGREREIVVFFNLTDVCK